MDGKNKERQNSERGASPEDEEFLKKEFEEAEEAIRKYVQKHPGVEKGSGGIGARQMFVLDDFERKKYNHDEIVEFFERFEEVLCDELSPDDCKEIVELEEKYLDGILADNAEEFEKLKHYLILYHRKTRK
jgi:hypothetical protein